MYFIVRALTPPDQARVAMWDRLPTQLEWCVEREDDDRLIALHGCDLIREWDRESGWKLPRRFRSALHSDLRALLGELNGDLEVTATWIGDPIEHQVELSRADLLDRVLANRVANRMEYRVPRAALPNAD